MHTCVNRLRLMTSDARWSTSSPGFPFARDLWSAPHTDPTHIQPLEGIIPSLLIGEPIQCQVVEKHIDAAACKCGHGDLESRVERHEEFPPSDHAVAYWETVGVVDHLRRQCPDQKVDSEK